MIFTSVKAQFLPWLIGAVAAAFVALGGAAWWLMGERDRLLADVAEQAQALNQATLTNADNLALVDDLQADIEWMYSRSVERIERQREQAQALDKTTGELREALTHAPCSGPDYLWPDDVYNRMRRNTVSDPGGANPGQGAGAIPGAHADPGAAPAGG